jgi:hypothetical protein
VTSLWKTPKINTNLFLPRKKVAQKFQLLLYLSKNCPNYSHPMGEKLPIPVTLIATLWIFLQIFGEKMF